MVFSDLFQRFRRGGAAWSCIEGAFVENIFASARAGTLVLAKTPRFQYQRRNCCSTGWSN